MDSFNSNSPAEIKKTFQEYYPNLSDSLKKFVKYATPVEIGFSFNDETSISVMFSEGFKGFLVVNRKDNIERRIAFVRTFFGRDTNIPAIDFVEVVFENNMPIKRNFLNVLFLEMDEKSFFRELTKMLERKDSDKFLETVLEKGKKSYGPDLVPLTALDKKFAEQVFISVTEELKRGLERKTELKDVLISYVTELQKEFYTTSKIFTAYLKSI